MKPKFGLLALITILATFSMPLSLKWTAPLSTPQVLAQTTNVRKAEADRLFQQGIEQDKNGQFKAALQSLQEVLKIYREIKDRQGEGQALIGLGIAYQNLGDYAKAIDYQEQALVIAQEIHNRQNEGVALGNLGMAYLNLGDYAKTIEYEQQALVIAKEIHDRQGEGATLGRLGMAYLNLGDYAKAIEYEQQALAIAKEIHNRQSEGATLGNLGAAYLNLGDYAKAIEYEQQALAIAKEIHDRQSEGQALGNLGAAYLGLANNGKAIEHLQQFLVIAREIQDRQGEGQALGNLGIAYFDLGNYGKAIEYLQQRLAIAQEIKDRRGEENGLGNLGMVYQAIGNYDKTIDYHQQSLAIAQEIKDRLGEGQSLGSLGLAYLALHDYSKAIDYLKQGLAIAQETKNRNGEGAELGNLGVAYLALGNSDKAIKYSQQQLVIGREIHDRHGEATALGNLGLAYLVRGNYAKAIEYEEQDLVIQREIKDPQKKGEALSVIGYALLKSGNHAASEKNLTDAIHAWESLRARLGSNDANKVSIFEEQVDTYKLLQKVLIAQNKAKAALEIAERGRARALVELLAARLFQPSSSQLFLTPPKAQEIQQIAKAQNATLVEYSIINYDYERHKREQERELELFIWVIKPTGKAAFRRVDLKKLWQQQNISLKELAPNSSSVVPVAPKSPAVETPTPESGKEIAILWRNPISISLLLLTAGSIIGISIWGGRFLTKKAAQNTPLKQRWLVPSLLLVLAVGSSSGLFFLMTRTQAIANNRNFRNDSLLAQLVDGTRESLRTRGRGLGIVPLGQKATQGDKLQQLHQILIQPIADLLPSDPNARIIFIPQSSLFLVPFPALKDASGKYLIEKHTILTAPSIQTLDLTHKQKQRIESLGVGSREALVVGNPTMPKVPPQIGEPPQQLPRLPGAQQEAKAIAKLLKTTALTGDQATKQAILQKMSNARIVHLATHGLLDDIRGLGSAIALAPSSKDDGLLTAEQILDLKLNAELVVLSACDTGKGRITGDGVIGLSRSLISAGVPSVIVSLWSVPDSPTAELMTEFYRNLQRNPDKAQALRQAMLTVMKQHPNPIDWAAFTLIGEAK